MPAGTSNAKVPHMSVTNVGASPYPTPPPPWSGQPGEWQAGEPGVLNSNDNNVVDSTANGVTSDATGNDVTRNGVRQRHDPQRQQRRKP